MPSFNEERLGDLKTAGQTNEGNIDIVFTTAINKPWGHKYDQRGHTQIKKPNTLIQNRHQQNY